jgi:hypothetical protein
MRTRRIETKFSLNGGFWGDQTKFSFRRAGLRSKLTRPSPSERFKISQKITPLMVLPFLRFPFPKNE